MWAWDSHVLWREFYTTFALVAAATERVRLGPCVTNPATRDMTVTASAMATLQEVSGGRMDIGMGRGDSARRVIGQKPVTVEQMEDAGSSRTSPKARGRLRGHPAAAEVERGAIVSRCGWPRTGRRPSERAVAWPTG